MGLVIGLVLILGGFVINMAGGTMTLAAARRFSTPWFLGCVFGIGWPLFCVVHFRCAWKPLLIWLLGACLCQMGIELCERYGRGF